MAGPADDGQTAARRVSALAAAAAASRFLWTVTEWSARLDNFCAELEREGFDVKRDGWSVTIDLRPPAAQ